MKTAVNFCSSIPMAMATCRRACTLTVQAVTIL